MKKKFSEISLEGQLFFSFIFFACVLLVLTMAMSAFVDIQRERKQIDNTISNVARYVASMDGVIRMLEQGYPDPEIQEQLDNLSDCMTDVNVIMVCDKNRLRYYHTDRQDWGDSFADGEEDAVLNGSSSYITTGYGTNGEQRRAFCSIKDENGNVLGYVMTCILNSNLSENSRKAVAIYFTLMPVCILAAMLISNMIIHLLQNSLQGHKPAELLDLYLMQGKMLDSLADGLVITNTDGNIVLSNRVAQNLFEQTSQELEGKRFSTMFPSTGCEHKPQAESVENQSDVVGTHPVLVTEFPIMLSRDKSGTMTVFHDRTETMQLYDELSGTKNVLDSLRLFNHEYMNKLHVILGYLQIGQTRQAMDFIINSSLVSSQAIREAASKIRVSKLCALIVGKMMRAAELGIRLSVRPDSLCMENDLLLPVQEYVTIIGNLLENAIEELSQKKEEPREIYLTVYCRPDCNVIMCEDTGGGIEPEVQQMIFQKGFSTKGENRGIGLYAIRDLVERCGGTIEIDSEKNVGTDFTITFTRREENEK